jgi:hypothetical protein
MIFRYRDQTDGSRSKLARLRHHLLSPFSTFCPRFVRNFPTPLSNRVRNRCSSVSELLGPITAAAGAARNHLAAIRRIFGVGGRCPTCKLGRLVVRAHWRATRAPLDAVLATLSPRAP